MCEECVCVRGETRDDSHECVLDKWAFKAWYEENGFNQVC